jgi:hypothetical protein
MLNLDKSEHFLFRFSIFFLQRIKVTQKTLIGMCSNQKSNHQKQKEASSKKQKQKEANFHIHNSLHSSQFHCIHHNFIAFITIHKPFNQKSMNSPNTKQNPHFNPQRSNLYTQISIPGGH